MKIISRILSLFMMLAYSSLSNAATSGVRQIEDLKAQTNGTYVKLENFTNNDSSVPCENNTFFLTSDSDNYEARTSFLLAAFMAGKPVNISYYDCYTVHIEVSSVIISRD